jgi:hypothetical protein
MSRLWLGNIEVSTTDEEIGAFLQKYGFPSYDAIERVAEEGSRPVVICTFEKVDVEVLHKLQERIHNMFWHNRRITAQVVQDRFA